MDSDQGKLFVGGISWETSEEKLREYFGKYGDVTQTVIMKDKATGKPRGFGFVVFADPSSLDRVLQDKHTINGRTVEAKKAMSREEQQTSRPVNSNFGRNVPSGGGYKTKKIFVGGLPPTLSEDGFRQYFEHFGIVTDVVIMYDQNTQRPRGFGFISFDAEDAVDRVLHKSFHDLNGKLVEVKRALPKDANPGGSGRPAGGGGYQGYGGSGGNNSYDGNANRYMQPQATGGGYPAYGSSGYGGPGYGYGAASNGVGYGGYGVGGYGSGNAGYGAPGGAYGNAPNPGYISSSPGGPRSPWNSQAAAYGSAAYGANTGYGPAGWGGPGSATGGGAVPAQAGQYHGAAAYGNQGYGYGGNEGYVHPGSYGGAAGRASGTPNANAGVGSDQQGAGVAYIGGGYGDANANSSYMNAGWRSDPSHAGGYGSAQANGPSGGYGSGYGGAQSRQPQHQ